MFDIGKAVDFLKLPVKVFVALAIATGLLVLAPLTWLEAFGLDAFVSEYRPYIGAIFLVCLSVSLVSGLAAVLRFYKAWFVAGFRIRQGKLHLKQLTPGEKELLAHYIDNQTRSQMLPLESGVVQMLVSRFIIQRASNMGTIYGFDYVIQPWAWEHLNKNRHLLD
jgi:hypothetical protein